MSETTGRNGARRVTSVATAPFQSRGRLMTPDEVAEHIFHSQVRGRWVLENAPSRLRVPVGKKVCFWEAQMSDWVLSLQGDGAEAVG